MDSLLCCASPIGRARSINSQVRLEVNLWWTESAKCDQGFSIVLETTVKGIQVTC